MWFNQFERGLIPPHKWLEKWVMIVFTWLEKWVILKGQSMPWFSHLIDTIKNMEIWGALCCKVLEVYVFRFKERLYRLVSLVYSIVWFEPHFLWIQIFLTDLTILILGNFHFCDFCMQFSSLLWIFLCQFSHHTIHIWSTFSFKIVTRI